MPQFFQERQVGDLGPKQQLVITSFLGSASQQVPRVSDLWSLVLSYA